MLCPRCNDEPCSCVPDRPHHEPRPWVYRDCEAEHCTVVIRELPGQVGSRFCKWCTQRGIQTTKDVMPTITTPHCTKDQFGVSLYEAIRLFACREQVQQTYKVLCTKEGLSVEERKRRLKDLKARETDLTSQIEAIMPKLGPADVRRILRRFEQVKQPA